MGILSILPIMLGLIGLFYFVKLIIKISPFLSKLFHGIFGGLVEFAQNLFAFVAECVKSLVRLVIAIISDLLQIPRAIFDALVTFAKFTVPFPIAGGFAMLFQVRK